MGSTGNMLENLLRQRIISLEDSLARLASTRKELHDNVDVVKNEIRLSFGHQLSRLRHREQQILEKLDTVASVKDGILSTQQDQLHQALGACSQGLEWLQTAFEDLKTNRLTSSESVEHRISDILNKLSSMDVMPRETAHVSFENDPVALRRAISSFGQVRSTSAPRHCESLPCGLEDYEDEECGHTLLHKTVHGTTRPITTVAFGRPKLSTDPKDCLLKEALTCSAAKEGSGSFDSNCESQCNVQNKRQNQVHNWLHQIKSLVENEPAVFEDFEIIKKRMVANQNELLERELENGDVLFRRYFEMVLNSPAQHWLIQKRKEPVFAGMQEIKNADFNMDSSFDECDSCHSSFTLNTESPLAVANSDKNTNDEFGEFWCQFMKKIWDTSNSMWLLPCASDNTELLVERELAANQTVDPCMTMECADDEEIDEPFFIGNLQSSKLSKKSEWLLEPVNITRQNNADAVANAMKSLGFDDITKNMDYEKWLMPPNPKDMEMDEPTNHTQEKFCFEDALGWKAVLEKVHGLGDEKWLLKSSSPPIVNNNVSSVNRQMFKFGFPSSFDE